MPSAIGDPLSDSRTPSGSGGGSEVSVRGAEVHSMCSVMNTPASTHGYITAPETRLVSLDSPATNGTSPPSVCLHSLAPDESTRFTDEADIQRDESGVKSLNQYVFLDTLGKGSCGKVKHARDTRANRDVAIKIVHRRSKAGGFSSNAKAQSITREIALLRSLLHPNVVPLYEVIDDPQKAKVFIVMPFCDKGPLRKSTNGDYTPAIPAVEMAPIAMQIITGLKHLHNRAVAHRDIKPENILLNSSGQVLLSDFGVSQFILDDEEGTEGSPLRIGVPTRVNAAAVATTTTAVSSPTTPHRESKTKREIFDNLKDPLTRKSLCAGAIAEGTPLFMSPEILRRRSNFTQRCDEWEAAATPPDRVIGTAAAPAWNPFAADIGSLGVTFFALLTGHMPFRSIAEILRYRQSVHFPAPAPAHAHAPPRYASSHEGGELAASRLVASMPLGHHPRELIRIDSLIRDAHFSPSPRAPSLRSSFHGLVGMSEARNEELSKSRNGSSSLLTYGSFRSRRGLGPGANDIHREQSSEEAESASRSNSADHWRDEPSGKVMAGSELMTTSGFANSPRDVSTTQRISTDDGEQEQDVEENESAFTVPVNAPRSSDPEPLSRDAPCTPFTTTWSTAQRVPDIPGSSGLPSATESEGHSAATLSERLATLPTEWRALIAKMLHENPSHRPSAKEVKDDIKVLCGALNVPT